MDLGSRYWIYLFHIFVAAPLLMIVPILYIKDGSVDPKLLETWFYILIALGIAMISYHGMKLWRPI